MEIKMFNLKGEKIGDLSVPKNISEVAPRVHLLHEVVKYYLARRRQGTASTKTRGEVRGGGRKPWRQKGTGRARHGSIRSPIWRGGGVTFGPKPRDYGYRIPRRKLREALKISLKLKTQDEEIFAIEDFSLESHKTKEIEKVIKNLKLPKKSLLVMEKIDKNLKLASRNLDEIRVLKASCLNTYELLAAKKVVFTKSALEALWKSIQ